MKKPAFLALLIFLTTGVPCAHAAWIWSPDIGKWINPKQSAKDTPEDQFAWALQFYEQKDWDRAIGEFEKIPDAFPNSKLAAEGVYYTGLCWEEKGDLAKAADAYQKLVDRYPYSDRIKDAVKREFAIADEFASGGKIKVLNVPVLPGQEKAIEIYKHIIRNAPYGFYGDQAQFKIGEVYKAQAEFEEAQKAFQAVVDEYPSSPLVPQARYQIAYSSMQASKKAQYNDAYAERAIEEFKGFKEKFPDEKQAAEADAAIQALREKKAQTSLSTAAFYEKQHKIPSARVYYKEVVTKYPESQAAQKASAKLAALDGVASSGSPMAPANLPLIGGLFGKGGQQPKQAAVPVPQATQSAAPETIPASSSGPVESAPSVEAASPDVAAPQAAPVVQEAAPEDTSSTKSVAAEPASETSQTKEPAWKQKPRLFGKPLW